MLRDPLVAAICILTKVWAMVDEMVVAQARWLPQYVDAFNGWTVLPLPLNSWTIIEDCNG